MQAAAQAKSLSRGVLSEKLRRAVTIHRELNAVFMSERLDMPAQYIQAFLLVAAEPGLSVTEYALKSGVSNSVMSRHLLDIGDRNRHMAEGFGLVTSRANPMELRKHEYFLTPKGERIAEKIGRVLEIGGVL